MTTSGQSGRPGKRPESARPISWIAPSKFPRLRDREIHVWRAALPVSPRALPALEAVLTDEERRRAARFRFERDRASFAACRGILRFLLGRYEAERPREIRLGASPSGKPFRLAEPASTIRFNVSHCGSLALFAFSRTAEVGVDVERLRSLDAAEGLAARFFAPEEIASLAAVAVTERRRAFFTCWTRKEAYVKAKGDGLSIPLASFSVTLAPGERAALTRSDLGESEVERWTLVDLPVGLEHAAALAAEGSWSLAAFRLSSGAFRRPLALFDTVQNLPRDRKR